MKEKEKDTRRVNNNRSGGRRPTTPFSHTNNKNLSKKIGL
jgi:hypothetical protein